MKCKYCLHGTAEIVEQLIDPLSYVVRCKFCGETYRLLPTEVLDTEWVDSDTKDKVRNAVDIVSGLKHKKLLIVEYGSIDLENCEQDLLDMGIKCIVYRQGSQPPKLYDLGE